MDMVRGGRRFRGGGVHEPPVDSLKQRGLSCTEQSMGDGFMLSHAVKSCPAQQPLDPEHATICQLYVILCIHYAKALCTCTYRKCQHNAETIHRINTGKIIVSIINYNYFVQWNLCQWSPELPGRLA